MDPILIAIGSAVAGLIAAFGYQSYASKKSPKKEPEEEARKVRSETLSLEAKLAADEESLQRKLGELEKKESILKAKEEESEKTRSELVTKLEKIGGVTREEAKKLIMEATESHFKEEVAKRIKDAEEQIKKEADERAKHILVDAMQHGATDYVAEYTTTTIKLEDDDMKGRIIGKEGRNIKAFEAASGVDIDLEDQGVIRLSSFDGERREVAKVALERLIADGRIQPSRIEEVISRVNKEFEKIRREEGEKLAREVGVHNLPLEIIDALGKFKWRFSYGQNLWLHTLEETKIGMAIARDIGADLISSGLAVY